MNPALNGKRVAFLATDGLEQIELTRPWKDVEAAGATPELISLEQGEIQGFHHFEQGDRFSVDTTVDAAQAKDYVGLVLPGGVHNPDALRTNEAAVELIKDFVIQNKPVAAICHGPWTLVEADVIRGKTLTSWPSLQTDIENAGATWVDQPVCVDAGLITSRNPDDLDAFCASAVAAFADWASKEQAA